MKKLKIILSLLLSICLCAGVLVTVFAENALGVTFTATTSNLTTSDQPQTAVVTISSDKEIEVDSIDFSVVVPEGWTVSSVTSGSDDITIAPGNGKYGWYSASGDNVTIASTIAVITYQVPANATTATVGVSNLILSHDYGTKWENGTDVTTTLTITTPPVIETPVTDPYNSDISTETEIINNDGTSQAVVKVTVGGTEETFNSAEIQLTYDPELLSFAEGTCLQTAEVQTGQTDQPAQFIALVEDEKEIGTLIIRDFGGALKTGEPAYRLTFDIVKGGNATVALENAGFSTSENAATEDLTVDEVDPATDKADVVINHKATISNTTTSDTTTSYVTPNGDLEFTISEYNTTTNTYEIAVSEDGEPVDDSRITVEDDGTVTVSGVTGQIQSYKVRYYGILSSIFNKIIINSISYTKGDLISIPFAASRTN